MELSYVFQGLMYCMQAENLVEILGDIGYGGCREEMELRGKLAVLKARWRTDFHSRNAVQEYWESFYGQTIFHSSRKKKISKQHSDPLPAIPVPNSILKM